MTKVMIALVVVVFAADLLWQFYQNRKRNGLLRQLDAFLNARDYAAFDELIASDQVRKSFPAYNVAYMQLNKALYKEDMKEIEEAFSRFEMPMNSAQKEALYKKGFYYYLGLEDQEKTAVYYELLKELKVKDLPTIDMMYDIYIAKGWRYLDQVEERAKGLPEDEQMPLYALLSDMYRNKGDAEKADEYEKKVSEYTEKLKS